MRVAVWCTGHSIADTVGSAIFSGLVESGVKCCIFSTQWQDDSIFKNHDVHIGYGILRGMSDIYRKCDSKGVDWFNVDLGYTDPGHFSGNYRISHRGTQAIYDGPRSYDADNPLPTGYTLICPPSDYVCQFFGIDGPRWLHAAVAKCKGNYVIRQKGDKTDLDEHLAGAGLVVTFNSSVGWKAIAMGIPCLSDTTHSVVGSYYNTKCIDSISRLYKDMPREPLFRFMSERQFSLDDIKRGKAWSLIENSIS